MNILSNLNSNRDAELKLYNISGKLLCSRNLKLKVNQVDKVNIPNDLPSGIYVVSLTTDKEQKTKKIVL